MKILICDDQAIVRDGLELLLRLEKDMEVIGLAQDGEEALSLVEKDLPDVVLMDLKMPGMNGVEATRRICSHHPGVKVLVLTTFDDDQWVFDAIRAGASGYLLKDTSRERVVEAIRGTVMGKSYVDPLVAPRLLEQIAGQQQGPPSLIEDRLSGRETEVLRLLARGYSNGEIAGNLHLSEGTVRNHVSSIFSKLDVADRTQAAILAVKYGLDR